MQREPIQIPTLGDLQRTTPWVWLWCERLLPCGTVSSAA
jgi:hypothetical protein